MREIKIFTTYSGKSEEQIVKEVNEYLRKGWKIKGNMLLDGESLKILLQRKVKEVSY